MTSNSNPQGESEKQPQGTSADYRIWRYVDPMARVPRGRKGITLEACLIGCVLIAVWVNAGIIVWRNLLG